MVFCSLITIRFYSKDIPGDLSFDGWLDFWLRVCQALNQGRIF